jgi:hypothetical protein
MYMRVARISCPQHTHICSGRKKTLEAIIIEENTNKKLFILDLF